MMVADTGAIVAEEDPGARVLPWAVLPEVDDLRHFEVVAFRGRPRLLPRDLR